MGKVFECLEKLTAAEERVAAALERLVEMSHRFADSAGQSGRENRETQKEKAVRVLVQMGVSNITKVAREVGVTRKTLYAWPETRSVIDRLRAVEAWEVRAPRAVRPEDL